MSASGKLIRQVGSVSSATLVSRILGYARDALVAYAFGGGVLTDAFYAAFRIPNLFRRFLGEGSLTVAFVPIFTEHLSNNRREEAKTCFQTLFTALLILLVLIVGLGIIFAPQITHVVAWGFKSDPEKFELTVQLTRLTFPFLLFVSLAAMSSGALNSLGYFFWPALAPAMLSVCEIGFVPWLASQFSNPLQGLALSAVAGGAFHFFILVPLLQKTGLPLRLRWNPTHPDIRRVGKSILPAVWGLSVDQVNSFVDTICASFLVTGSVTAIYNSNRLMQFPLALFGISVSTASLPSLSASAARQDFEEMKKTANFSIRMIFFTILPAMAGLILLGVPVIELLFEHGRFTHRETLLTNAALVAFCLGLPAFASVKVLASFFYALKNTRTPVKVATLCMIINMIGNLAFMQRWGVGGLAFATTLASIVNAYLLFWLIRKRYGLMGGWVIFKTLGQSLLSLAPMMIVTVLIAYRWNASLFWRVPLAVTLGGVTYLLCAKLLHMEEYAHLWDILRPHKDTPKTEETE